MKEKEIERKLVKAVRDSDGLAVKLVSPGLAGVPDRMVLFTGGKIAFCELKAPGQKPRPLQLHRMEQLRALGFRVYVVDDPGQIEGLISDVILSGAKGGVEGSYSEYAVKCRKGESGEIQSS